MTTFIQTNDGLSVTGNITVTSGYMQLPVYANTTVRDAAVTTPAAGMMVFLTTGTVAQVYTGAAWANLN